jgi:hypothetical protein
VCKFGNRIHFHKEDTKGYTWVYIDIEIGEYMGRTKFSFGGISSYIQSINEEYGVFL